MANWFYFNNSGEKIGPITPTALKSLAQQGLITPETVIENGNGRSVVAGKVNGLTFSETTISTPPTGPNPFGLAPSASVGNNPFNNSPNPFGNPTSTSMGPSPFTQPSSMATVPTNSFCTNCGQSVNPMAVACMACGANPKGHKRFCGQCGVPINEVQVVCIKCGAAVAANSSQLQSSGGFWDFWSLKPNTPLKSRSTYILIALCLGGGIGMHNVYAGRSKVAMLQLIIGVLGLFLVFPTVIVWFWAIVDCFNVKEDGLGRPFI